MFKNIAVILAGGSGTRFGKESPKQFTTFQGKMIIEHSIDAFEKNQFIEKILVVCGQNYIPDIEQVIKKNQYKKIDKVLVGGNERYQSSLVAINSAETNDSLFIHDAVRPLVSQRIITDCVKAMQIYQAVNVGFTPSDTIFKIDEINLISEVPKRKYLRLGQSPQAFKRDVIKRAYEIALKDPDFSTTDDCGVVQKYLPKIPIFVVEGEVFNMKLTYQEDLLLFDMLFKMRAAKECKRKVES